MFLGAIWRMCGVVNVHSAYSWELIHDSVPNVSQSNNRLVRKALNFEISVRVRFGVQYRAVAQLV